MEDAPLDLREVFSVPWAGEATIWRPWWLRWVPLLPRRFAFRTEVVADGGSVLVNDTQAFPDGRVWHGTMRGDLIGPGVWRMSAEDMPGGTEITVRSDGYSFKPYTIWAPILGPLTVPLRCSDDVRFEGDEALTDTIMLRFLGLRVGVLTMHLRRVPGE